MQTTREIPPNEWKEFFNQLTKLYHGWYVTIEVFGSKIGAQTEAREMILEGFLADLRGNSISIIVGETPTQHVTHTIPMPSHVRLANFETINKEVLEIETDDGFTTLVRFWSAGPVHSKITAMVPEGEHRIELYNETY